jgi:hypothetical protein
MRFGKDWVVRLDSLFNPRENHFAVLLKSTVLFV